MSFIDLLKRIRGLHCKYNNGTCRVEEVYWEIGRALIKLDEGTKYWIESQYGSFGCELVSDGYDRIVVDLDELVRFNSK